MSEENYFEELRVAIKRKQEENEKAREKAIRECRCDCAKCHCACHDIEDE